MLSSDMALRREDYFNQLYHILIRLNKFHDAELVFDPINHIVDDNEFERSDLVSIDFDHARSIGVDLIASMSQPRGIGLATRAKVDANHASDISTIRSITNFIVYLRSSLIY